MRTVSLNERDHLQGDMNAPIVLVEYGDFQCAYCGAAYPHVKKLKHYFDENICFVFRHFPLTDVHPAAYNAALAMEAAAKYNKFWELHDMIFEHQDYLQNGLEGILMLGQQVKISPVQLHKDMRIEPVIKKVEDDFEGGVRAGVNGTPTFYINGYRYNGIPEFNEMAAALQQVLV